MSCTSCPASSPGPGRERVLVRKVSDLPAAVTEALDFLEYDFRDRKVWVKPNLLSPRPPADSVTTQPELIRLVVRELRRRGAAEVWVSDNPGGRLQGDVASYIALTGAVEASEGCFVEPARDPVLLPLKSRFVPAVRVSRFATAADVLLNLPVLKTHALTLLTGSIKNLFGIVTGTQKARLHVHAPGAAQFAELLVDIFQAVPVPVLTIMDAILGMDGQSGPGAGRTLRIGRLITGRSAVAVDTVMAAMAGARPGDIPFLRHAGSRGLGPTDPAAIDVVGDFAPVRGFRLPSAALAAHAGGIASVAYHFIQRRPVLDRRLCTRCQRCVSSCPVGAITAAPFPRIDRHRCITCYCCAETCPAKALSVPGLLRGVVQYFTGR